jgi:hypothetical protein
MSRCRCPECNPDNQRELAVLREQKERKAQQRQERKARALLTPWQKIIHACDADKGVRLSAKDCRRLGYDDAIRQRARLDDEGRDSDLDDGEPLVAHVEAPATVVRDALLLVGIDIPLDRIEERSLVARKAALLWAANAHLRAADNKLPELPCPAWVAAWRKP